QASDRDRSLSAPTAGQWPLQVAGQDAAPGVRAGIPPAGPGSDAVAPRPAAPDPPAREPRRRQSAAIRARGPVARRPGGSFERRARAAVMVLGSCEVGPGGAGSGDRKRRGLSARREARAWSQIPLKPFLEKLQRLRRWPPELSLHSLCWRTVHGLLS